MPRVFVQTNLTTVTDYHDGERYGDWETEYSYQGCKVFASPMGELGYRLGGVDVDFKPQVGQVVFPVIVSYGSGDSFGRSSGNITIAAVTDSSEKAVAIRDAIQKDNNENPRDYKPLIVEGQEIYTYTWKGYFESLEWVRVETELVRA